MSDGSRTPPPPDPSSHRKHVPPPWAGTPTEDYFLEVIKDGAVIQKLPISDRDHFVLGGCGCWTMLWRVFSCQFHGCVD
jgi:hypothetical protein